MTGARALAAALAGLVALAGPAALAGCGGGGGDDASGRGLDAGVTLDAAARRGQEVAEDRGCTSCHSADGDDGTGPTWRELWGTTVELGGGRTATVDRAYVTRSIRDPDADVVDGYTAVMPDLDLSDAEIDALVTYIQALR